MPPCGISYPRASRGGTLVRRLYRRDHASATRGKTFDAMSHYPLPLSHTTAAPYGAAWLARSFELVANRTLRAQR